MSPAPSAPPSAAPSEAQLLRLAVQNLACHPQAQRRYVQMGLMARALGNLQRLGGKPDDLVADGSLTRKEAAEVASLRELVAETLDGPGSGSDGEAAPREYLFSRALEDEGWERVRQRARGVHALLAGETSVFVAIMAK